MPISNRSTQTKLVILNIKKKIMYYLDKKIFKNQKKYIILFFNQLIFFYTLCGTAMNNGLV